MRIIPIDTVDAPELADYTRLTDVALRRALEPAGGLYLAESTKVIRRALAAGHIPRSVLLHERWLPDLEPLLEDFPDVPVYVGSEESLEELTGFHLHRGALAAMHRPELPALEDGPCERSHRDPRRAAPTAHSRRAARAGPKG